MKRSTRIWLTRFFSVTHAQTHIRARFFFPIHASVCECGFKNKLLASEPDEPHMLYLPCLRRSDQSIPFPKDGAHKRTLSNVWIETTFCFNFFLLRLFVIFLLQIWISQVNFFSDFRYQLIKCLSKGVIGWVCVYIWAAIMQVFYVSHCFTVFFFFVINFINLRE